MRKSLLALIFGVIVAGGASAQFIHDLRPIRPGPPPSREPRLLPIQVDSHQVSVDVNDGVASTKVHLTFRNPNGLQLEGTFMFPMPDDAAIGRFAMKMGGRMVEGEVLEKDKAAGIYQSIVQRQMDPALLEFVGRRLFQAKVFPIPPSGTSEIELAYDEPLRRDGRTVEYRYPFRTRGVSGAAVNRASLAIAIRSQDPVLTVYSPSHEVDVVKKGDHEARVTYERAQEPGDRDVVVVYGLGKESVGATLFTHAEKDDEGAFLLLLAPSSSDTGAPAQPKDVVFVVDTSGSMAGDKIEQTRKAIAYCVNSLGASDRFNIVPFATEAQPIFEGLQPADDAHRQQALAFVRERMAARGGTNINDALVAAMGMSREKDRPFIVIFMTDGEPTIGTTTTDGILANVKKANQAMTRLFVFGVGEELKVDLLDLLAEQNHGSRDYVGAKESIEVRISSFFEKVSSPVLSDVKVEAERVRLSDFQPKQLPDLFRGSQLLVTGRFQGLGTGLIRLKGTVAGKPVEHVFELTFKKGDDATAFVPRLWAVRKAGWLIDQIRLNGESKELKDEVVRLGKTYGIVTPYTSYLVVEDVVASGRPAPTPTTVPPPRRAGEGGGFGGGGGGVSDGRGAPRGRAGGEYHGPPAGGAAPTAGAPAPSTRAPAPAEPAPESKPGDSKEATRRLLDDLGRASSEAEVKYKRAEESARKSEGKAPPADAGLSEGAKKSTNRDTFLDAEAPSDAADKLEKERKDRDDAAENLRRGYFTDAIALSQAVKGLRESRAGEDAISGAFIRRAGNRTFFHKAGLYVESPILDMEPEAIQKKLVRIEAFSKDYFDLLQKKPDLSKVLALGNSLLFVDGDRLVQIVPAGTLAPAK